MIKVRCRLGKPSLCHLDIAKVAIFLSLPNKKKAKKQPGNLTTCHAQLMATPCGSEHHKRGCRIRLCPGLRAG